MTRKLILGAATTALVLFLALPLIFDIEDPAPLTPRELAAKGMPLAFNPEGSEMLPVVKGRKAKLPGQSANFLTKYFDKVGNFYRKSFEMVTGVGRAQPEAAVYYANATRHSYGGFTAGGGASRDEDNAYYYDNASNAYRGAAVRQTPSGDAPVRGLYETSLTDIDKIEGKKLYSGVMRKVNRAAPDVRPAPAKRAYAPGKTAAIVDEGLQAKILSAEPVTGMGAPGFASRYTGIAPRQESGGSYGGFGGATPRAAQGDSQDFNQANFERAAGNLRGDIRKISDNNGSNGVYGGGYGASGVQQPPRNPLSLGAIVQGVAQNVLGGPNQPGPLAFDPNLWTPAADSSCAIPGAAPADTPAPAAPPAPGKIDTCDIGNLPVVGDKIAQKYERVLVVLGTIDGGDTYVTLAPESTLAVIMEASGFPADKIYTKESTEQAPPGKIPNFSRISKEELDKLRRMPRTLEYNLDPNVPSSITINNIEFKEGQKKLVEDTKANEDKKDDETKEQEKKQKEDLDKKLQEGQEKLQES